MFAEQRTTDLRTVAARAKRRSVHAPPRPDAPRGQESSARDRPPQCTYARVANLTDSTSHCDWLLSFEAIGRREWRSRTAAGRCEMKRRRRRHNRYPVQAHDDAIVVAGVYLWYDAVTLCFICLLFYFYSFVFLSDGRRGGRHTEGIRMERRRRRRRKSRTRF